MKCKNCKDIFKPKQFNRKFCTKDECNDLYFVALKDQYFKKLNKEKKERKKKAETVQSLMKSTQKVFNSWIRKRDYGQPCISCQNPNPKKVNAGHYIASGKSKFLSFNELNVHLQCESCNNHKSGNLIEYRINLIDKIGKDKVEYLEENRHITKIYSRSELIAITEKYKKLLK